MIVVDTSVLVDFLRGTATAAARRLQLLEEQSVPFALPAICCQEVLQGAKDKKEWDLLLSYLESQRVLHPGQPWDAHVQSARIYYDCRRRGITLRSTLDCLIAQLTLDENGILLHDDEDFERMKEVCRLRTLRE